MLKLAIDIGNTNIKSGIFEGSDLKEYFVFEKIEMNILQSLFKKNKITKSIVCNVGNETIELEKKLKSETTFLKLDSKTKLPFTLNYKTPETLGTDRIAAVAGAHYFFPDEKCIVIDAGTCITYDFISSENIYFGGAISPGLQMRLNAMHTFTHKLPEIKFSNIDDFIGTSTESCLLAGAFYGIIGEINNTISRYKERFGSLQTLICGGDSTLFVKHIKSNIFAAPNLILYGLNRILDFQDE